MDVKVSFYLNRLTNPTVFPDVKEAVKKNDSRQFAEACRKAKIPKKYANIIKEIVLSTPDQPRWP